MTRKWCLTVDNVYMLNLDDVSNSGTKFVVTRHEEFWLWHRRLGNVHFDLINRITSNNLVIGLSKIKFLKEKICDACQMKKRTSVSFKLKKYVSTSKPLKLLHLDILTPSRTKILGGNFYGFVIVYDFSRFTCSIFLSHKKETLKAFVKFFKLDQNQFNFK